MQADVQLDILGGGPAGLAVAYYADAAGVDFRLFERSNRLGGHCRTHVLGAHRYDSGAHRFHDRDADITHDVQTLLGDELQRVAAPSQVLYGGRFLDFPPRPLNWLRACGPAEGIRALAELLWQRRKTRPIRSFEDLVATRYGMRLGRPLLLDYSEKLWGLPGSELAPEVATRRLAGLRLTSLVAEVLRPQTTSNHLDGSFFYPRSGYGVIADRLAAGLPADKVHRSAEITGLSLADGHIRSLHFADGSTRQVDGRVVNTLPLTLLVRMLGDGVTAEVREAVAGLRFRHVRLVYLRLGVERVSPNASIYLPEPSYVISRISEPKNRSASMAPAGETSLVVEVPCWDGDPVALLSEAALTQRVVDELERAGLVPSSSVLATRHHFLANAYPVYSLDYRARRDALLCGLTAIANLDLLGRGGRFWYSHLHDQMRAAKDYVASLRGGVGSPATS